MSESEVSQIRDEDVLRRMWQATEDFGRKKEIRAHMYRLREERLRNLYSPEPPAPLAGKGSEFSAAPGHGQSFAHQSFQSMKSKEVRDAGSPPKEYSYRGQDLKELSNAGWNVESEDRTTDDGRTHVKFVNANVEGSYDVQGGRGQFAAVDKQRRAVTEHQDARSSLRRDELSSDTAAHDHGARVTSTTSSSTSSSKVEQVSSTTRDAPPEHYDSRAVHDSRRTERVARLADTGDYEQTLRAADSAGAELVARKVEYPDDSTKVIVETRLLPDGTRVTSTRREFRAPAHSARSEHRSRSQTEAYSSHRSSDLRDSSSTTTRRTVDDRARDIVDSQRNVDDLDFKRQLREYTSTDNDDYTDTQRRYVTKTNKKVTDHSRTDDTYSQTRHETKNNSKVIDQSTVNTEDVTQTQRNIIDRRNDNRVDETDRRHTTTTQDHEFERNTVNKTRHVHDSEEKVYNISKETKENEEIIQHVTRDRTIVEDQVRDIPKDRIAPTKRLYHVPKTEIPTAEKLGDFPRDRPAPADLPRDDSRNERAPVEKIYDAPRNEAVPEDTRETRERVITGEKVHHINRDTKVEEVIERKTSSEHYQTTYQNDYQTRKVSTDWSPTHQAWASTLRADTPSTTRPSTRASSPGSRTFKSSTSSVRSSVSPDKSYKKPSSRGGSPNKLDRYSPTRTVSSDRYSSTHSSHSVTEERINKNTSPERKPPTGRSPARPSYSPDRKLQDGYRQRPSVSPEKKPKKISDQPNSSPDWKPSDGRPRAASPSDGKNRPNSSTTPRQSPERRPTKLSEEKPHTSPYRSMASPDRKPVDSLPSRSPGRSSPSPDRKAGYQKPTDSPVSDGPRNTSPSRPGYPRGSSSSPDRKPGFQKLSTQPGQKPDKLGDKNLPQDSPTKKSSVSPDRKPGYMKPTASTQPADDIKKPSEKNEPDRKSPSKQIINKTSKIKEDHYKFVDEETKVYTHKEKTSIHSNDTVTSRIDKSRPREKSPSTKTTIPREGSPDYCKTPESRESPCNKSKSPNKDTKNDELYSRDEKTVKTITTQQDELTDNVITVKRTTEYNEPEEIGAPNRETSPSKYGTYDKKKPREGVDTSVVTMTTTEDTKDVMYDSLTRKDKTSPKKMLDTPSSPSKKSPRDSVSPLKSPTKDTKYKQTTDFISTERSTEEINKKTTKSHPRQLVTPSSSPTRRPKLVETEPSTGQSSPTTSVSGFVYFGSPRTERPMVTDLDDFYPDSENPDETTTRPDSLDFQRSPSPSKIPCRSPSPEKHVPTTKDSLPRKSSLKKPTTDYNQSSPVEKPPTSFRISPTDDKPDLLDNKTVKKDKPSEPETGKPVTGEPKTDKPKPPLQRRETYDDRCKKILGLVDDTTDVTTETMVKETKRYTRKQNSSQNSPSVSPCDSPAPNESSLFSNYPAAEKTTCTDVTDFISHEREELTKTAATRDEKKTKSRDNSPTKLKDITRTTTATDITTTDKIEENTSTTTITIEENPKQIPKKMVSQDTPKGPTQKRSSESPERKRTPSPSKLIQTTENIHIRSNLSPERKTVDKHFKDTKPETRTSPEKKLGHNTTTTSTVTSSFDATSTVDNVQETITLTKTLQPTRVLESPTRDTPKSTKSLPEQAARPRTSSPSKLQPRDGSPVNKTLSPDKDNKPDDLKDHQSEPKSVLSATTRRSKSPEKTPNYMKSTTAVTSKFDTHHMTENVVETFATKTPTQKEPKIKASSPTRKPLQGNSPTKPSQPSDSPMRLDTSPQRKPTSTKPLDDKQVPGYMRSTKTTTTKFDQITVSEDTQETSKSTVEKERITSVSPTRKPTQPKSPSERRTPSPTKPSRPTDILIDKNPAKSQLSSPAKENSSKRPETKHTSASSPTRPSYGKVPGYMKTTASMTLKHDDTEYDSTTTEDIQETITSTITDQKVPRNSESPSRHTSKSPNEFVLGNSRTISPSTPSPTNYDTHKRQDSPVRKPGFSTKESPPVKSIDKLPKATSPTSHDKTPGYMKTTAATSSKFEITSTTEDTEEKTLKHVTKKHLSDSPIDRSSESNRPRTLSPSNPTLKSSDSLPDRKPSPKLLVKDSPSLLPENKQPIRTSERPSSSPETPSYMKPTASITSKFDSITITHETQEKYLPNVTTLPKSPSPRKTASPDRQSLEREPKETPGYLSRPEEPRQLRTPSPVKKTTTITEANTDFIMSEREQEILNKVQKSLRKLSPERKEKSPSRERSPTKTTTSLQDLDIVSSEIIQTEQSKNENLIDISEEQLTISSKVPRPSQLRDDKPKDQKAPTSKPTSRNVSPTKKAPSTPTNNKADKIAESPTKSRSFSPKKPVSHVERPQSPQQPKSSGIKPREQIPAHLTRKPTPATLSTTRIERLTTDVKKTNGITKQSVMTKTTSRSIPSPTGKPNDSDIKRSPVSKTVKDNVSPKKDAVTRTTSDIGMKPKKTSSPQRMKSKPEIQVNDMSTKSPKYQKPIIKEPHSKLPNKPKSATSLNTSIDEDDVIIDVQQSKSSRENSPDRICPTPINFADDVGVPRFPDEVSEPDDDLVKRTHHTIHEAESVVDDIVEICEDEELFIKKTDMEHIITRDDDSLLSVNDKVNKFTNKIQSVNQPKHITTSFKDTERRVHSDFVNENLKSDECLLTVSEKVNKFAKGPRDTKDSRSPSRKITDEYDKDTVYTDDYTKLSVNDKAHLFVETAENVKTTKVKPAQKVERPDFSNVDESLKSDDCLLSVSDKVNKFVKTAEQYLTETQEYEEKETKIKEQHEKVMKQIVDDDDEDVYDANETLNTKETHTVTDQPVDHPDYSSKARVKEPKSPQPKVKDYSSPTYKPLDRVPAVKITTLRSSEAVKKAKALFENIASTQKTTKKETVHTTKTTKLTDIGVIKKSPKTDSTTVLHPSVENVSPHIQDVDDETDILPQIERPSSGTFAKPQYSYTDDKLSSSPNRLTAQSPEMARSKSPMRQTVEVTSTKTALSRYPAATRAESPRQRPESPRPRTESPRQRPDSDKHDKIPGYLRPTKTSQIKEETKVVEEAEVSSRRGSGKFGVELRRTSVERSTVSSERRRSVEHHQPCIEDIFDLDLLEQMLEKVVGYEQRRRIRAQIRVAKSQSDHVVVSNTYTRTTKQTTTTPKLRSPERKVTKSPERVPKSASQRTSSPERHNKSTPQRTIPDRNQHKEPTMNGHAKEPSKTSTTTRQRPHSPEKPAPKTTSLAPRTPVRQPSPDKRRTTSPSKAAPKPKGNRFNEYASAYMKKVGLNESDKVKLADTKTKKTADTKQTVKHETQQSTVQEFTTTKSFTERTSSKDVIEIVQTNGKRSPSPEQRQSPARKVQFPDYKTQVPDHTSQNIERRPYTPDQKPQSPDRKLYSPVQKAHSPERLHQRTPSPDFKRPKQDTIKETIIKTVYDIEKKIPSKPVQEEKPMWVTNRNLKKITSETRTFSSKKVENEKPKYRAASPSKIITKPTDVITSSYGPGPRDADGKPLFGIKALRNGATNFQVKGTVIRQEFHSRNGGEPEGTVSVTAYSSQPEELERLLAAQGAEPPSRLHGLAAITTTKKFRGDTGNTLSNVHTRDDRASLEQFTHHDRRVEHLENRTYDSNVQDFEETRIEEITEPTRRTESKQESRLDNSDRTRREEKVTQVKKQKVEERREKMEKREDKKTVRQNSVKSLTEKFIKSANDSGKADRSAYPKAGLILRTTTMRDSVSSDDAHPAGLVRADSEHSVCSGDETVVTTTTERGGVRTTTTRTTHHPAPPSPRAEPAAARRPAPARDQLVSRTTVVQEPVVTRVMHSRQGTTTTTERSFLDSSTKVTGVQDILTRMKNADIVIQEGDSTEDSEARALLNKFLGATVLMAGMQGYVQDQPGAQPLLAQETVRSSSTKSSSRSVHDLDLDQCWDERLLKQLLDECTDYEQRRRLRARIRTLMAEQEACASAVTEALGAAAAPTDGGDGGDGAEAREEEEVTVTSSVRRDSTDKTVTSSTTTRTSKVIEMTRPAPKPVSPFAKFRQLEKQNSTNSPNSPKTPQSPGSPSQPYFKFTDPALQCSALTIKERLLQWCRDKTRDYENVKLENFSTSWADGLAFCALVHHFLPDAFDYSKLTADKRRHNFTLAFKVADEKAGIYPLLDVDDMVAMRKPDWKCVFTYVQAIYRRFKDEQ